MCETGISFRQERENFVDLSQNGKGHAAFATWPLFNAGNDLRSHTLGACSTIGPAGLNFRVRDGNGWIPRGKITDKSELSAISRQLSVFAGSDVLC